MDVRGVVAGLIVAYGGAVAERSQDAVACSPLPVLLGQGEALFAGLDLPALGYRCERQVAGERATHVFLRRDVP